MLDVMFLAASITWTAPPPQWTTTNQNEIRTVNMSVVNGSTQEALRWDYTLPAGSDLRRTDFHINKDTSNLIGSISHDTSDYQIRGINDYQTRFNISRSEVATLIINEVTVNEEAVYQCELVTRTLDTWKYNIQVIVTGGNCYVHTYMIVDKSHSQMHVNYCPPYPPTLLPFILQTKGI